MSVGQEFEQIAILVKPDLTVKREVLRGIAERAGTGWELDFFPDMVQRRAWEVSAQTRGVIAWPDRLDQEEPLMRLGVPVVWMGHGTAAREPRVAFDNAAIGRRVAEHLRGRGLRNLAMFADRPGYGYSQERRRGFEAAAGGAVSFFDARALTIEATRWDRGVDQVVAWLRALPKPVGILADRDGAGYNLALAARHAGLRMPDDVAVVGVGNDEALCNLANPRLSSVALPGREAGRRAADLLGRLLAGKRVGDEIFTEFDLVERASSDVVASDDEAVGRALRFIRERAEQAPGTEAVAAAAGVSRRVLERRFVRIAGRTVQDEVARVRLELARRLLLDSELAMGEVAQRCGFAEPQRFSEFFRRMTGKAPRDFRREARVGWMG